MTIFRSSVAALAALTAGAVSVASAQIPIQRPIQQAQQAQQGANPPAAPAAVPADRSGAVQLGGASARPAGAAQDQQATPTTPASHTVAQGETLWGLAQTYLGDPMLWPEIYRLNTTVIEDPHWIYPGEELRLSAPPAEAAAPAPAPAPDTSANVSQQSQSVTLTPSTDSSRDVTPAPQPITQAALSGPTIFTGRTARSRSAPSIEVASARAYRAVREGEYFSSGFLTEGQPLNSGTIISTGAEQRGVRTGRHTAQLFEDIVVSPPPGDTLQPGDLLLSFRRTDVLGDFGQIVLPTGLLKVVGPAGTGNNLVSGQLVRIYQPVEDSQELIKVQPFINNSNLRAVPIEGGVEGHVIRLRDARNTAMLQDVLFIDKGANDGLRLGDLMQVYAIRTDPDHPGSFEQDQARALIVSTRARTSTALIVALYRSDVSPRSQVRQVRRMPS